MHSNRAACVSFGLTWIVVPAGSLLVQQHNTPLKDQPLLLVAGNGIIDIIINKKKAAKRRKYAVDTIMTFYVKAFMGVSKACLACVKALAIKKGCG
jgi:hypothetical protein